MSNQIVISSGAKVRNLDGVLTGTSGIVNSLGINVPDGIPQLDGSGKILVSQLPNSVMEYKGTWNAATNTPTLANGTGNAGDVYLCNVAGTVNFGAGPITFAVGDQVLYSGTTWEKASGATGTVTSVAVTESGDALTITGSPITTSGTINIGFAGTGAQYVKGDGTLATFPTTIDQAKRLITEVYNSTGSTLTKGTVVYINGGQGNLPTITKAQANADNTSAQTYGVVQSDITNNNNGFVVVLGSLTDLDTQAYSVGTQLYLSGTTAGEWTSTKPSAPIHLVYVGIVVRSHPTQGVVEIRIQNGYELEELHDVAITSVANNDGIFYNSSTDLWENKTIGEVLGYTPANASLVVPYTGATANVVLDDYTLSGKSISYTGTAGSGFFKLNQQGQAAIPENGTVKLSIGTTSNLVISSNSYNSILSTSANTADRTYTFPDASGTLALTSDLSGYLPLTGGTLSGILNISTASYLTSRLKLTNTATGGNIWSVSSGNANNSTNNSLFTIINETLSKNVFVLSPTGKLVIGADMGTTNPADALAVYDTNTIIKAVDLTGNNSSATLQATNTASYLIAGYSTTAIPLIFKTGNTDRLTIAANGAATFSGSLTANSIIKSGGTSSQFLKADGSVDSNTYLTTSSAASTYLPLSGGTLTGALSGTSATFSGGITTNAYSYLFGLRISGNDTGNTIYQATGALGISTGSSAITFAPSLTTALTLASTGAATFSSSVFTGSGIGVGISSLSSWSTVLPMIEGVAGTSIGYYNNSGIPIMYLNANIYFNGSAWVYKNSGKYGTTISVGAFDSTSAFEVNTTNTTGTAGGTASLSKVFVINQAGNVGIGTSSPSAAKLQVSGSNSQAIAYFYNNSGSTGNVLGVAIEAGTNSSDYALSVASSLGATRLYVRGDGNVGIGTSSPSEKLDVIGGAVAAGNGTIRTGITYSSLGLIGTFTNHDLGVITNGSERMRITSGGDVLIGTSTYGGVGISMRNPSTYNTGQLACVSGDNAEDMFYFYSNTTTLAGIIGVNGNTTSYYSVSDYRAKQDLKDFSGLDVISKFKMYDFEWISDGTRNYGGIAHEIQEVLPYAVTGEKDGERNQAVDYAKIVPVLVKAIQELNEKIKQLENK